MTSTVETAFPRVIAANPEEFEALLAASGDALLVLYMWGPNCPNCDFFASRFPALRIELSGVPVTFVKVDVYEHPELARRYGVFGIPHFLFFKAGRKVGKMSEFRGDAFFLSVVREQA